tara:strand:- start:2491 stop:3504 length:1014 start_codon:yes stop_codon:yes gene_type:complete
MLKSILITGANGEMGHGLIKKLSELKNKNIVCLDIDNISGQIKHLVMDSINGSILDENIISYINDKYKITEIYHLAALLSSKAEHSPQLAQEVNVNGTLKLLNLAIEQSKKNNITVKFFFPSSIAVYGLNGLKNKNLAGKINEKQFCLPETIYGCNKLYSEHLGRYYSIYYNRLSKNYKPGLIDFRSIRFPGLISAYTLPTGGTTDYAPEMLHAAASNESYTCYVNENTTLPFMIMDDAIESIIKLMSTQKDKLNQLIYNIGSYSVSALDFKNIIMKYYNNAKIKFCTDLKRQSIVDSWPKDINYDAAVADWKFSPKYNFKNSFKDYLIPIIRRRYE